MESSTLYIHSPVERIGYAASIAGVILVLLFPLCFVGILLTSPLFVWTHLEAFMIYYQENDHFFQDLAMACMLLLGPCYLLLVHALNDGIPESQQIFSRLGINLGVIYVALTSIHYFVQLTVVRFLLQEGQTEGMALLLHANPHSVMIAIDMLGFTLFLGLSSLFMALGLKGVKHLRLMRWALRLNGGFCLVGGIAYMFQFLPLLFFCINIGMGGSLLMLFAGGWGYFRRQLKTVRARQVHRSGLDQN